MAGSVELDSPDANGDPTKEGSGYYIGDGIILTAGHVVYEFNEKNTPANRVIRKLSSVTVVDDSLGYFQTYQNMVAALPDPHNLSTDTVEVEPALRALDSILIAGSGSVNDDDAGLVVYLSRSDMVGSNAGLTAGTTIERKGRNSDNGSGQVAGFNSTGLIYNHSAVAGDSGGALLLKFDGKEFVLGNVHSTNQSNGQTFGTYFDWTRFQSINNMLASSQSGDVTSREPTNLIVGTQGGNTVDGSFRADIILGRGGNDVLSGGDSNSASAWADDKLFGGEDNDTLQGGRGADLLHGGDHRAYSGGRVAIEDDGEDTVSYADVDGAKGIKLQVGGTTASSVHASNPDFAKAVFVTDENSSDIDTLISIEKLTGTSQKDTLLIKALNADLLAGADKKGGLLEFDMGDPDTTEDGDLIDFQDLQVGLKVDLANNRVELKSDSAVGFGVLKAENVYGGKEADEIIGSDKANELRGGTGADTIKGGKGEDIIRGGDDSDEDRLDGGENADKIYAKDKDIVVAPDKEDKIFLDDKALAGGERDRGPGELPDPDKTEITTGRYKGKDGTLYDYDKEAKTLVVTDPAGAKIKIEDFQNKDGGIELKNVDYSFKLTTTQAEVEEGRPVTVRVELSGPNITSGFSKDIWVHVSTSGVAQPVQDFDLSGVPKPFPAKGANQIKESDGFFVLIPQGRSSGTAVIQVKPDTNATEGDEALTFTIDNYYSAGQSASTGISYSTPTDAASVIAASDKQETITIKDSSPETSLYRSGGVEGFHKEITVAVGQHIDASMEAFSILDYLKIWDSSTGRVYVDTGYVSGQVSSTFFFDDEQSSGKLYVAIFTNDPGTAWNLAVTSRNPPATTSAAAPGVLGAGPETMVAGTLLNAAEGSGDDGGFSATLDGTLLHFSVSAPVAFEVKQGQDDPEGLGFRIVREGDASASITVGWRIEATGANPVSAADFAAAVLPSGMIVFGESESAASLLVQAFDDGLTESVETFRIVFFDPATGLVLETLDSQTAVVDAEIPLPLSGLGTDAPDLLMGTSQSDNLYGFAGNDILRGGFGADYLSGGDGHDSLAGGGGSDILVGGDGWDVYNITFGGGDRDRISDFGGSADTDSLLLSGSVTVDLSFRASGSDLVITNLVTLDEVRITNQFLGSGVEKIAYMLRGAEVFLSRNQIAERAGQFVYGLGDGQRTFDVDLEVDNSMVLLGAGITPDTLGYSRVDDYDLKITFADGGTLLVRGAFVNAGDAEGFSGLVFSDGSIISPSALRLNAPMIGLDDPAAGYVDEIVGTPGLDRIVGGLGDDLLVGQKGSDIYEYSLGDGYDTLTDTKGNPSDQNVLRLHGIAPGDVTLHRLENSVEIRINGQPAVLLDGQLSFELAGASQVAVASAGVNRIEFDDGEVWDRAEILSMIGPLPPASPAGDDDVLYGDGWDDAIDGLAGSDTISGRGGADTLDGGPGDDHLRGGTGEDYLFGDSGDDIFHFARGDGADIVWDWGDDEDDGLDILQFGPGIAPAEVTVRQDSSGRDFVLEILGTGDSVRLEYAIADATSDIVKFADGTVWTYSEMLERTLVPTAQADQIYGDEGGNLLAGGAGDDLLVGDDGDDSLSGDAGNDELQGGQGDDTYMFGPGGGQDEVSDRYGGFDTLELAAGIAPGHVTLVVADAGHDLILRINGTTDEIRLDNSLIYEAFRIEQVKFADGTVWSHSQMWQSATIATPGDDSLFGSFDDETIGGGAGADYLVGRAGNDRLTGGIGKDIITGSVGDDTVVFDRGDGQDRISDYNFNESSGGGFDTLEFGPDVLPSQIIVEWTDSWRDIVFKITGTTDQVILDNATVSDLYGIEQVKFADGTVWTQAQILAKLNVATASADMLSGDYNDNELAGAAGNDTLVGNAGDDRLRGGSGNDLLRGGSGGDTYLFGIGDGQDIVSDLIDFDNGGIDRVEFDSTIVHSSVTVALGDSGRDLVLRVTGTTDQITLNDTNESADYRIEEVRFADGTTWTHAQMLAMANVPTVGNDSLQGDYESNSLQGGAGNDTLLGKAGADRLQGDAGADLLQGGAGNDTYVFASGDGQDVVREAVGTAFAGGTDKIELGAGIDPSAVTVAQSDSGRDLILKFNGTTDQITLDDSIDSESHRIEQVIFANGTVWSHAKLMELATIATAGSDTFYGGYDDDKLAGGAGDDSLIGRGGNDTFYVGPGEGVDSIDGGTGTDRIFATASSTHIAVRSLSSVEVIDARDFDDVWLKMTDAAETYNFSSVRLVDIAGIDLAGGNDVFTGSSSDDFIVGGAGNDVLAGGGGFDIFSIGVGHGFDSIDGGTGYDIVLASADNVALGFSSVQNVEAISANGFTNVTIRTSDAAESWDFYGTGIFGINEINVGGGNDYLKANSHTHILRGGDGDDELYAQEGDDSLHGDAGDDYLAGWYGNDSYRGGLGDDYLTDEYDDDIYYYGLGDGRDIIDEWDGYDILILGAGITAASVEVSIYDQDVIFSFADGGQVLVYAGEVLEWAVDEVRFADGTVWTYAETLARARIDGDDVMTGTSGADLIRGLSGADTLYGEDGDDVLDGGPGDDILFGGSGNDTFRYTGTADGFDAIDGGTGTNTIQATTASTMIGLRSITGVQTITGMTGSYISGSGGNDTLSFLGVTLNTIARIEGGAGNDTITGNSVANTLWGGLGNDVLSGDAGADILVGDDGDDVLIGGLGNDSINGASGIDTVDYGSATAAWTVNLSLASAQGKSGTETDTITNVENVTGGAGADTITGNAAANALKGGSGNDRITGGAGNDNIDGGIGTDVAVFAGLKASYSIVTSGGTIQIVDNQATTDGNDGTDTLVATEKAEFKGAVQVALAAPIILDLDGDGLTLIDRSASAARFDWDGDGHRDRTGWMGAGDGMLVYDRDRSGTVSGAGELSFVNDRPGARSDLDGLRAFDSNGDGIFSADDAAWADFRVWNDRDGDGSVDRGEFLTLLQAGVASISLDGTATEQSWAMDDNVVVNHGQFLRSDGTAGSLGDVALNYTPADHRPVTRLEAQSFPAWPEDPGAASGGRRWQVRQIEDLDLSFRFHGDPDGAEGMFVLPPAGGLGEDGSLANITAMIVPLGFSGPPLIAEQPFWL